MKIFNISDYNIIEKSNKKRVAALGFFDGVHKAHQKIISEMVSEAREGYVPTVITLDKSPKEYFAKSKEESLTPLKKKSKIFEELGVEEVYYLEFNEQLQNLEAIEFIDKILKKLKVEKVFFGYDYKYGVKGSGTPEMILDSGIKVSIHEKEEIEDHKISTTTLKSFVINNDFVSYIKFSGRAYSIVGTVIKGKQLGRTINFPTANLDLTENYLLPKTNGVYLTKTMVGKKIYKSLTNIGYNPTVSGIKDKKSIETHILDFDEDIYGEKIEVYFYEFLRPEKKFDSFNHLKEQLQIDKDVCEKKIF